MGKKQRNKSNAAQAASGKVKFNFNMNNKASDSTGAKRNVSAVSNSDTDLSSSAIHDNTRRRLNSDTSNHSLNQTHELDNTSGTDLKSMQARLISLREQDVSTPSTQRTHAVTTTAGIMSTTVVTTTTTTTTTTGATASGSCVLSTATVSSSSSTTSSVPSTPLMSTALSPTPGHPPGSTAAAGTSSTPGPHTFSTSGQVPGTTSHQEPRPASGLPSGDGNAPVLLNYNDLALALAQLLARDDISEALTTKFTGVVRGLIDQYEVQHKQDQEEIKDLRGVVHEMRIELNELKQYSRRNSVRITNSNWREHPYENCMELVMQLFCDLGLTIQPWMIDRVHRTGKHATGRQRDILVKFIGYGPKNALLKARSEAGSDPYFRGIYINEDLSAETGKLYFQARKLKKEQKLFSASTRDGRILVSRFRGDSAVVVKSDTELNEIASRGTFARVAERASNNESINTRLAREAGMTPGGHYPPPRQQMHQRAQVRMQQAPPFRPPVPQRAPQQFSAPRPVGTSTPASHEENVSRPRRNSFTLARSASFSFETY